MADDMYKPLSHHRGFAFQNINPLLKYWIASWDKTHPLLDIGCGSCINALQAVEAEAGVTVYATEPEEEAVKALTEKYKHTKNLAFHYLRLPDQVPFQDNSFSGILVSEVFHYLHHPEVISSVWELYRLLIPGGRVVITCCGEDTLAFQKIGLKKVKMEERQKTPLCLKAVDNYFDFVKEALELEGSDAAWKFYDQHKTTMKTYFNFLNADQLAMVFTRLGFEIELLETGPAPQYPLWVHGDHDQIRLVAKKPEN